MKLFLQVTQEMARALNAGLKTLPVASKIKLTAEIHDAQHDSVLLCPPLVKNLHDRLRWLARALDCLTFALRPDLYNFAEETYFSAKFLRLRKKLTKSYLPSAATIPHPNSPLK